jgi:hypothetical protein
MANTYTLIASNTLSSSAASVTFSSIPATYTDLVLRMSTRGDSASASATLRITLNNDSSTLYSFTRLRGDGSSATSGRGSTAAFIGAIQDNAGTSTSNTFTSTEIYIPSYTASQNKPLSIDNAHEDNVTLAYREAVAGLYRSTTAISRIDIILPTTNFVSGSSFFLYGILSTP